MIEEGNTKQSISLSIVIALIALMPILPVFLLKSAAPLMILCGVTAGAVYLFENKYKIPKFDRSYLLLFVAFFGLCALSLLWSINIDESIEKIGKLALILFPLLTIFTLANNITAAQAGLLFKILIVSLSVAIALYVFEYFSGFMIFHLFYGADAVKQVDQIQNRSLYLFFLLVLPCIFYAMRTDKILWRILPIIQLLTILFLIAISMNSSAAIISALVLAAAAMLYIIPLRAAQIIMLTAMLITAISAPFIAQEIRAIPNIMEDDRLSRTFKSRIEIWDFTARRIEERPFLGWGIKSSPFVPDHGEMSVLYDDPPQSIRHLHPHNGVLEIWLELGLAGITLLCALFGLTIYRISLMLDPQHQRLAMLSIMTVFLYTLPSYGLWQSWFIAMLGFGLLFIPLYGRVR